MTKSKTDPVEAKTPPKSPFSGFSRFGGQKFTPIKSGFTPKGMVVRPTFVTQHKGGGGK